MIWIYRLILGFIFSFLVYNFVYNTPDNPRPEWWGLHIENNNPMVAGLSLHQTTLAEAASILKTMPQVALFTKRQIKGEPEPPLHLEAYFEDIYDQGDSLILSLNASPEFLSHIKAQAYRPELRPDDTILVQLTETALQEAQHIKFDQVSIITGSQVDYEAFASVFGKAEHIINDGQGSAHFLYAAYGLDFIQPSDDVQILQITTLAQYHDKLLQPLLDARNNRKQP